jgi:hypothetical protein
MLELEDLVPLVQEVLERIPLFLDQEYQLLMHLVAVAVEAKMATVLLEDLAVVVLITELVLLELPGKDHPAVMA